MKHVLCCVRRACDEHGLIEDGDKIAVGISGGKDSMLMLYALHLYKMYMKKEYTLHAVTVDMGFDGYDTSVLREYIAELGIPYTVVKTEIAQVVFDIRNEKNPCSLCSRMRKGAFYEEAKRLGCNKAAFGHHADDLVQTLMMSMMYESKLTTFLPKTYLSRRDITLIRPLIFMWEKDVIGAVNKLDLPISKNPCPANSNTKREEMKDVLKTLMSFNPDAKKNILTAIASVNNYAMWDRTFHS